MKSIINKEQIDSTEYPKLGVNVSTKEVVLFFTKGVGSVIYSHDKKMIGYHSTFWIEETFDFSKGLSVTLTND